MLLKNTVSIVSLYIVNLENPENQNYEIAANTSKAGTRIKLLISICILTAKIAHFHLHLNSNVTIKFIRIFR